MATLPINDLPRNEEMDSSAMTATQGGFLNPVLNNVASNRLIKQPVSVTPVGGVVGGDGGSGNDYDTGNSPVSFGNDPSGDGGSGGYLGDGSGYRPF